MQIIVKLIGCAFVLACGIITGYNKGRQFIFKADILEDMVSILTDIKNSICYRRATSYNAINAAVRAGSIKRVKIQNNFCDTPDFHEHLRHALDEFYEESKNYVNDDDFDYFKEALLQLGSFDKDEEAQKLTYAINTLKKSFEHASTQAIVQMKLYRNIGAVGGIAAVLLLI